jgi:hypothetical protein
MSRFGEGVSPNEHWPARTSGGQNPDQERGRLVPGIQIDILSATSRRRSD